MSVATVSKVSKSKFEQANVGDIFSEVQFYRVTKKQGDKIQLQNDAGTLIVVDSKYMDSCLTSASTYEREEKVTRTDLQKEVLAASGVAMTINFNTKVDEKKLAEEVSNETISNVKGATMAQVEEAIRKGILKGIKEGIKGEERTIKGRHFGKLNSTGRIDFIDMEDTKDPSKDYDNRQRQVDPRTINWAIIRGVKYVVK